MGGLPLSRVCIYIYICKGLGERWLLGLKKSNILPVQPTAYPRYGKPLRGIGQRTRSDTRTILALLRNNWKRPAATKNIKIAAKDVMKHIRTQRSSRPTNDQKQQNRADRNPKHGDTRAKQLALGLPSPWHTKWNDRKPITGVLGCGDMML